MRYGWLVLLVGCGSGSAAVTPFVEPVIKPTQTRADVIDLQPFMPDVVPVIETFEGRPTYAFRRGDDVFPLVAKPDLATTGACLSVPLQPGAWVFPDGSVFTPADGMFWQANVVAGAPCWRWSWLPNLSAFTPSQPMVSADSVDERSLSLPLTSGDSKRVATFSVGNVGTLSFGGVEVANIVSRSQRSLMISSTLALSLTAGRFPPLPEEVYFIDARADDVSENILATWQGTATSTRLVQWLLLIAKEDVEIVVALVEARGLPLKTGATLDLKGGVNKRNKEVHFGTYVELEREASGTLSFGGKSIVLWPAAGKDIAPVARTAEMPFALDVGGCHVVVGSDRDGTLYSADIVVGCETTHTLTGPFATPVDGDEMRVDVRDLGPYLVLEAEDGGGSGLFLRRWYVPKHGGAPLVVYVDDLEQ